MESILVKDIYTVDTISKNNGKAWIRLMDMMEGKTEPVLFDFKGINVIEPWVTPEFKLLIQNELVHMKLWCSATTVKTINMMCTLNGISSGRVVNEEIQVERVPTKEELKVQSMAKQLQEYFDNTGDIPVLNVYKRFDQIGVPITVEYIAAAVKMYAENTKAKQIHIEAKNMNIQASVIEAITNIIPTMADLGVIVTINSEDSEVMNKVGIYKSISRNNIYGESDKLRLVKAKLHPGKVGMLIRYKETKGTDEFGRKGKGKPISCRVAVYQGMKRVEDSIALCFRTYNGNTFYTRTHWALEHDNDVLKELDFKDEVISLPDFGMYNDFLGAKFHFIAPIQMDKRENITMYGVDEFGKVTYSVVTIPERIKAVFEDWGIEHDGESLMGYIKETQERLKG